MSAKTGNELITAVEQFIGGRTTGTIGGVAIPDVVLDSLNRGLWKFSRRYDIATLQREATIAVVSTAYVYAVPVLDKDSNTIRIKNILSCTMLRSGETTGVTIQRLTHQKRTQLFPHVTTDNQSRPSYYTVFGTNLELYPYPDDAYTLRLFVNIWPNDLAASGTSHSLGEEWDDILVEFAVADVYAKMQQMEDAAYWQAVYRDSLKQLRASLIDSPDFIMDMRHVDDLGTIPTGDPQNDPFTHSWNS